MSVIKLIEKAEEIKPLFTTDDGEELYTFEDYATLAEYEKATKEKKITSTSARIPSADGASWKKGAKIAKAINPSVFFGNVARIVKTTEEVATQNETEPITVIEHEEVYVVLDDRAVLEHARQFLTANKVEAYVFRRQRKKIKYDRIEEVKKDEFVNEFNKTLGVKTVIEIRKQLNKSHQKENHNLIDLV